MPALSQFNWIDWIIVVLALFYVVEGFRSGLVNMGSSLSAFSISLWSSFKYRDEISGYLLMNLGVNHPWCDILGLLLPLVVTQIVIARIFLEVFSRIFRKFLMSKPDKILGATLGLVNTMIIGSIACSMLLMLPIRAGIRQDVNTSYMAPRLVFLLDKYGGRSKSSLETVAYRAREFVTVKPRSDQMIYLNVNVNVWDLFEDAVLEKEMLRMINSDRLTNGQMSLKADPVLTQIAANYSQEMFTRKFFSHIDPDGKSVKDRLEKAVYKFSLVGENIAYAPDLENAYRGLMDSQPHRANILNPSYTHVGIGIINGSSYGLMITQIFVN